MRRQLKRQLIELGGPARQIREGEIEIGQGGNLFGRILLPSRIDQTQLSERRLGESLNLSAQFFRLLLRFENLRFQERSAQGVRSRPDFFQEPSRALSERADGGKQIVEFAGNGLVCRRRRMAFELQE
ncbi:MAG: hypothetical protein QOG51_1906, partial [Verrucomicrobiota bacterium]